MSTTITGTEMTSDATRHTAAAGPDPGPYQPRPWSVTWLPGRELTRDQAITAMTIAEVVATHDLCNHADKMWAFIDGWAAELGISGPHAVTEASLPPEIHAAGTIAPIWGAL
jgi:hypothetical protein